MAIKIGQSRETGNIGYTRHRRKTKQRKTTPHYVLDTKGIQDTGGERRTKENHITICVGHQGYTRHRRKTNKGKPHHNMCWTPRVYKTQDKDKQRKTTPQYVLDTTIRKQTHIM